MGSAKKTKGKQVSSSDLLDKYRAAAAKVKADAVQVCRADTRVAFANVKVGVESVFGADGDADRKKRIADVQDQLPRLDAKKATKLPDLARALMLAAQQVGPPVSTKEIEEKLAAVSKLRDPILTSAELLAQTGCLPLDKVAKIRSGSGKYDIASDGVALADLFATHVAKVKGKHPFSDENFATMREASEWLLDRLTPAGAKKAPKGKDGAADLRDRLWTLLVKGHADLRVMGYALFHDEFDVKVPKLQSQAAVRQQEEAPAQEPPKDG